jgi:hypothetical protein
VAGRAEGRGERPWSRGDQARLARLLPELVAQFEGVRTAQEIRACADAILDDYDNVPIRMMVMTLAPRRARECLAAENCDVLAPA